MTKIIDDYVGCETAKILAQKGFDEFCHAYYEATGEFQPVYEKMRNSESDTKLYDEDNEAVVFYAAPTLQMVVEWLRVRFGLFVTVKFDGCNGKTHQYYFTVQWVGEGEPTYAREKLDGLGRFLRYKTPSDAYRAAIDEVLTKII